MKWKVGGACGMAMRWLASKLLRQPQRFGARSTFTLWASMSSPRTPTRTMLNAEPPPLERRRTRPPGPGSSLVLSCLAAVLALGLVAGAAAETWRGLTLAPEHRCSAYNKKRDYPYPQSVERDIVRELGAVYGPYTGTFCIDQGD